MVNTVRNEKSDYDSAPEDDLSVRRVVQQLSALLAAGLGLFALIAWISGKPQLAAFGQGMIPMAPSTAILFLVFGSIIFFHSLFPLSLRVNRLNQLLGWIGTLISLLLFALYLVRVKSSIEHFGFRIADTISGVSIGYMSPVTAICFAFTGLAILALLSSSSNRKWRFVEAYGLAAVVAMVNVIMIIAYLWGKPLFYGTSIIPPAIPTSLSFVMIGIAILLLSHQQASVNNDIRENTGINAAYFYIAMFTLAATGIITLGYLYIRNFEQQYRAEIDKQLVFVANAKTDGLLQWKHERLGNASVFYNNPAFVTLVSRYFDDSTGVNNQKQLHGWLAKLETYAEYDRVILLDTRYNNRMSVPEKNEPVDKPLIKQAIESMRSGQIGFVDFYLCENDHRVYLGIIVPIIDEPGNQRIGAIALCIDPEKQLYPTINKQFQLNRTGESILVRRDGDSVLFLNELKFRKDSALKMRVSIANHKEFPSVKAVLGQEGIVEGIDYRDMPVIAAVSAVPGTPWFLLDKIDQSEAYAPVRNRAWMTIGLVGLLLLGMAISLVFVWRQRRMQYYHEKSVAEEALRESHEVLQAILNSIPARVFWKDKNLLLLGCNTAFAKDAGFEKPEDILGKDDFYMGWRDQAELYRADDRMVIESGKAKLNIDEPQTTPSGEQIHLLTSKVPLRDADGAIVGVLGTYQDITELKDFERKLKIFSDAVEGANDGFLMSDINGRISYVNRSIEKYFGYSREELMGKPIGILSKNPEEAKDIFKTVNNEGKWDGEVLSVKKDGEAFLASLSVSFVTTQDNIPIGTMGILRDITERKKAEQALRENEQRLRGILDATPFPIALVDVEGNNIEYWSRSAVSLFGHTASSATEWYQKAYPDANYRREVIKRWNNAQERARISGQAVNAGEYRITCDNGSIRICELYAAFIADKLIVTFNDLAERKLAEEALRESEEKYRTIIENMQDAFYRTDFDGNLILLSPSGAKHLGYDSIDQLIGVNVANDLYADPEDRPRFLKALMAEGSVLDYELRLKRKDGSVFFCSASSQFYRDADGKVVGVEGILRDINERKQAEQDLLASEERYRLLIENANEAIFVIQDFKIPFSNNKLAEILDYHNEYVIEKSFLDYIHPDDREVVANRLMARTEGGQIGKPTPFRALTSNGSYKWLEVDAVRIEWNGQPATLNFATDITEQIAAQNRLKESEVKFRTIFEHSPEAVFLMTHVFLDCNQMACELWEYSREEIIGCSPAVFSPEFQPNGRNSIEAATEYINAAMAGTPQTFYWQHKRKSGSLMETEVSLAPMIIDGKLMLHAVVRDITQRKRSEETLRKLATVIEQSADGVVITDNAGIVEYANPAYDKITGISKDEVVGNLFRLFVNTPQNAMLYNEIQASIKRKRTCSATIQNIKKDGKPFNESVTISPVLNAAGELINYVAIVRDITRQMALEQQMLQSQKMEAIGQLAGGVAHDFNNLLTAILGYGEILRNNLEGQDRLQKDVDEITKAGKRAAGLTRQLLAFSRKQVIQPKVLDLNLIAKDMHKMLKRLIGEHVELIAVEDKNLWKIKADPGQLEQIIMNLSVNARDAMPEGGKLTIKTANVTYDNLSDTAKNKLSQSDYVLLTVSDTGLGIPDDIKPHIFEPFYTTKEQGKGTGLGLATVYGIVEQSGGIIELESKIGMGTTFSIYLPRHEEPVFKTGKINIPLESMGGNETILIVEDDQTVMDLTQRLLSELGYNIMIASDPLQALEICKQFKNEIHLLLTDVIMPKMNGEELARAVKALIPEISILFMTGYTDNAFIKHEILESQGDLLPKPFSKELLASKIRELFKRKVLQKAINASAEI